MNTEFFITLPSNTKFDGNKTSNFKVRLPQKIILDGTWEVALTEIMYPHSWKNVSGYDGYVSQLDTTMHQNSFFVWVYDNIFIHAVVVPNHYGSIKKLLSSMEHSIQTVMMKHDMGSNAGVGRRSQLIDEISKVEAKLDQLNQQLETTLAGIDEEDDQKEEKQRLIRQHYENRRSSWQTMLEAKKETLVDWNKKLETIQGKGKLGKLLADSVKFIYDDVQQKVTIQIDQQIATGLKLSSSLAYVLGYNDGSEPISFSNKDNIAAYVPDLRAGFYALYVYCTLVENQIVGDHRVPLLRTVHVEGEHGEIREKIFPSPHYVAVAGSEFETIEIDIKDDRNNSVDFDFGKVIVKLHFRKRRAFLM